MARWLGAQALFYTERHKTTREDQFMTMELTAALDEAERLFYRCETPGNLERAEAILGELASRTQDLSELATLYGELAQAQFMRFGMVSDGERLKTAQKGVEIAKKALAFDSNNIQANAWAAALMGIHGLEMGILASLFYLGDIRARAEKLLTLDETYHNATAHQILGNLYRLAPPKPVGMRDYAKSLLHLARARELAPLCPVAKLNLAELYLTLRKPELARAELMIVLSEHIEERGPLFEEDCRKRARDIGKRLPPTMLLPAEEERS
jgi:tetratricopeptide (TPR) repeat protein